MAGRLENRVALITGAAMGIGKSGAMLFAREGATVFVADIQKDAGEATVAGIDPAIRLNRGPCWGVLLKIASSLTTIVIAQN